VVCLQGSGARYSFGIEGIKYKYMRTPVRAEAVKKRAESGIEQAHNFGNMVEERTKK